MTNIEPIFLLIVRVTLIFGLGFAAAGLLRGSSASMRHRVWALTLITAIALPLLTIALPPLSIALPAVSVGTVPQPAPPAAASDPADSEAAVKPAESPAVEPLEKPASAAETSTAAESTVGDAIVVMPAKNPIDLRDWLTTAATSLLTAIPSLSRLTLPMIMLWMAGATVVLVSRGRSVIRRNRVWERATQPPVSLVRETFTTALELGIEREIAVRLSADVSVPMTWGTHRPVLLIPEGFEQGAPGRRRQVLLHELAHIGRLDAALQTLAVLAVAIFWFHPLAWRAERKLRSEAERACDDIVILKGERPSSYAESLIEVARAIHGSSPLAGAVPMASRSELPDRISSLLDPARSRSEASGGQTMLSSVLAVGLALPISAFSCAIESNGQMIGTLNERSSASNSIFATAPYRSVCSSGDDARTNVRMDERSTRLEISTSDCSLEIDVIGDVDLTHDGRDVARVGPGGSLSVEEETRAGDRELTIRSAQGGLERRFIVDGDRRSWDRDGEEWLSRVLPELHRNTSWEAEERVARFLEAGGADAVLDEIGLVRSDHVRGIYLGHLIDKTELSGDQLDRAFTITRAIASNHMKGRILRHLSRRGFDSAFDDAFFEVAQTISSNHEKAAVIVERFESGSSRSSIIAGLVAARSISSNHELSRVARSALDHLRRSESVPDELFDLVRTISSNHEKRIVLSKVLTREGMSRSTMIDALVAAKTISANHELANVALTALNGLGETETVPDELFVLVRRISANHDKGNVLREVIDRDVLRDHEIAAVLDEVTRISASHEMSRVLSSLARQHTLDDDLREAYLRAASRISSDHERRIATNALLTSE